MNEFINCVFNCIAATERTNNRLNRHIRYQNGQNARMLLSIALLAFGFNAHTKQMNKMKKEIEELKNAEKGE